MPLTCLINNLIFKRYMPEAGPYIQNNSEFFNIILNE